jgi:DNA-binding response OmpR family regulator
MSETVRILLYSDDRTVREQVKLALGKRVAADLPELEIVETATHPAALQQLDTGSFDLAILDGEAVPAGGMGLAHQIKDEVPDCPPILVLVVRVADAWLATWSKADAIAVYPIDPIKLPQQVAGLLRTWLSDDVAENADAGGEAADGEVAEGGEAADAEAEASASEAKVTEPEAQVDEPKDGEAKASAPAAKATEPEAQAGEPKDEEAEAAGASA